MNESTRFIGIDDSKDFLQIAVADACPGSEVRDYGVIPNTAEAVCKLVRRLGSPKNLVFAYEAGPNGYTLYRLLTGLGASCLVAAPSQTPRRPGERIKNDRRDAAAVTRMLRAGELTPVWVPDEDTEAVRDLTRTREDAVYARHRARQRLQSFLLRHGRHYPGRSAWTRSHAAWLKTLKFDHPAQGVCFEEYLGAVEEADARLERLEGEIRTTVANWSMAPRVRAMMTHRGVNTVVAATVAAELGDLTRFDQPRKLMAFVGLVPSLLASGSIRHTGAITKTGNAHVRRCLVEAAWAYRHPARRSPTLRRRLKDQPAEVQRLAWKAQVRLCGRYRRLRARGKEHNKVVTAIARELLAFLWATAAVVPPVRAA
jgi:transposase